MDKIIEFSIDSLTYGGRGVGRYEGKAVFVAGVLPGERVQCRIVRDKKRYCEAELITVIHPSTERREPPCLLFSECGGCQWQHLPYSLQLHWKQKIFSDTVVRATGCDSTLIAPIIAAPEEMGYRCRAQIKCRMAGQGLVAGFYRTGSHNIVDMDCCPVLDPLMPPLLARFRNCIAAFKQADKITQIDFCADSFGRVSMIVHFVGTDSVGLIAALQPLLSDDELSVYLQSGRNKKIETILSGSSQAIIVEDDEVLQLGFEPGGFIQINLQQNRRLVNEVLKHAVQSGRERVLDLYSGIGNFSLPLARICTGVVGVEEYAPGVTAATLNAQTNRLDNVRFIAGRAEDVVTQLSRSERFDTVVLDPPRSGAKLVVQSLLKMRPSRIVYVSCDPTTLARDLVYLLDNGYRLHSARSIDMFPQTWHIEGVAVLDC